MGLFDALAGFFGPVPPDVPQRGPERVASPAHGALADAAFNYCMAPAVEARHIEGYKVAARAERVSVPRAYAKQDRNDTLTKRIRAACMDVCCRKIKRGDIGRSWEGEFVPEATKECKVAIAPILGGVLMWLAGKFIVWLIAKIIWSFIEEALERLYPGAAGEAPGTVVAGFGISAGIGRPRE